MKLAGFSDALGLTDREIEVLGQIAGGNRN